jgi:hypothetical protein
MSADRAFRTTQVQGGGVRHWVLAQLIRQTRFEDAEDAHQSLVDLVALGQMPGEFLLRVRTRFEVAQQPAPGGGEGRGRGTDAIGQPADKAGELFHLHVRLTQVPEHERRLVEMTQAAPQPDPIIAVEYARDIGAMSCQKTVQPPLQMRDRFRLHAATLIPASRFLHLRLRRQPR